MFGLRTFRRCWPIWVIGYVDDDLEVVGLVCGQFHHGVEPSAPRTIAGPVADVPVVEDKVAQGCVVADVADV
jgi:hypothetical protein